MEPPAQIVGMGQTGPQEHIAGLEPQARTGGKERECRQVKRDAGPMGRERLLDPCAAERGNQLPAVESAPLPRAVEC